MDLTRVRADTPGCSHRIHLNNCGASLMPQPVLDVILGHLELESRIGGYEAAAEAGPDIEAAYGAIADLLATSSGNVAFTEHATAGFVQALSSVPLSRGDVVLTTRHDYVSNQIQYLSLMERVGVEVVRAPDAPQGGVDVQAMDELMHRRRPRLVAVTHIPTNSGLVQDVTAIGALCRKRDVLYLVDACQSVGQMSVHPESIGCDFLSATSRKFLRGPRGAGFLWVSDRALESGLSPLFPDLRGADWVDGDLFQPAPDARRFETWEFAWSLVLGTAEAARYAMALGLEEIHARCGELAASLREGLAVLPGVRVLDRGPELCAIVTVSVEGHRPAELVAALRERGINTSSQTRIDAVLDYDQKGVDGALRISPHYFNTQADLTALTEALGELTEDKRGHPSRS
jgi:selenocysteine lyase/cysteine desulfurase